MSDPSLAEVRTQLAWRRTSLTLLVVAALGARADHPAGWCLAALAVATYAAVLRRHRELIAWGVVALAIVAEVVIALAPSSPLELMQ